MSPLRTILALAASLAAGGCNILTPTLYVLEGPGKDPARHTLAERKSVVLIDDQSNVVSRTAVRASIGETTGQLLLDNKCVPSIVSTKDALAHLRKNDSPADRVSMESLGRALGADQVIYVEMAAFRISVDGATPKPFAAAHVRVIDLVDRQRAYPADERGELVTTDMREVGQELYASSSGRRKVEDALAMELGRMIAELFYEHERVRLGENLGLRN